MRTQANVHSTFAISALTSPLVASARSEDRIRTEPALAAMLLPDGKPLQAGDILRRPKLAAALELIAEKGADAFYTGAIAENIVAAVANATGKDATDKTCKIWGDGYGTVNM